MKIILYGSRGFADTVAELVRHCGHEVVGRVDDKSQGPDILGDFTAVCASHSSADFGMLLAIGYSNLPARWLAWQRLQAAGYRSPALIHPRAYVADTASVAEGCMVMAGALVDVRARLDEAVVLWPGACISHDSRVGANTFVSPRGTLCGNVDVGAHSFIGANATVVDHVHLASSSFVKAGSVAKQARA